MTGNRMKLYGVFVGLCCLLLILLPMPASAQLGGAIKHGVQKGAHAVQKGAETTVDKTKEGAEAVGKGTKKLFTGDDDESTSDRDKNSETTTASPQGTTNKSAVAQGHGSAKYRLPRTAGELPLLALIGIISLAAAATRGRRRVRASRKS